MAEIQVKRDTYFLGQSEEGTINDSDTNKIVRLDVELIKNSSSDLGTVTGKVLDEDGNPVSEAIISAEKIDELSVSSYAVSGEDGIYVLDNLRVGEYKISCIKDGMGFAVGKNIKFTIDEGDRQLIEIRDFTLSSTVIPDQGIIVGRVVDDNINPIFGAPVSLYLVDDDTEILKAITYTNDNGEFAFTELEAGKYIINAVDTGYEGKRVNTELTDDNKIKEVLITLSEKEITPINAIAGVVTEKDNPSQKIVGADVILYKEKTDSAGNYLPVQLSKTNSQGAYVFVVSDAGTYQVRSNAMETITVTIPEP